MLAGQVRHANIGLAGIHQTPGRGRDLNRQVTSAAEDPPEATSAKAAYAFDPGELGGGAKDGARM